MHILLRSLVPTLAALSITTLAIAVPATISTYDIEQTPPSGFGGWGHNYNGTISDTGDGNQIFNYTGGTGSLNDGIISNIDSTHLFVMRNADDGQPIAPTITLHLDGVYFISQIIVYGGNISFNVIPGALNGATVSLGGASESMLSMPSGEPNEIGIQTIDIFDLSASSLGEIPTNEIVLSNFTSQFFGFPLDQFSIAEIQVEGTPFLNAVPEPCSLALLLLGAIGLAGLRRWRPMLKIFVIRL